jgi:hypothetical protein
MGKISSTFLFLCIILLLQVLLTSVNASVQVMVLDTKSGKYIDSALVEVSKDGIVLDSKRSKSSEPVILNLSGSVVKNRDNRSITDTHLYMHDAYPNPATNRVNFELYLQNYLSELKINIYNILGQRISSEKMFALAPDNYRMVLDISSLASSIYFIELISSQGERVTGKFVKIGNYSFNSIPRASFMRTDIARHINKKGVINNDFLPKIMQEAYDFRVFADKSARFYDTKNNPSDIEEGWVGVFGYANKTIQISGDTSIVLEMDVNYRAPKAAQAPTIDGVGSDACWENADWAPIDHLWLYADPSAADFSGQYKIVWTPDTLYYLVEIVDNVLNDYYENPLTNYYMDDCLEFFIDEDHSGGSHWLSGEYYNAFAYHISIFYDVVDAEGLYNDHINILRTNPEDDKYIWEAAVVIYDDSFVYGGSNTPVTLSPGKEMGFAIAYCDNDGGTNRESFIGSIFIDGNFVNEEKNIAWQTADVFATLELVDEE